MLRCRMLGHRFRDQRTDRWSRLRAESQIPAAGHTSHKYRTLHPTTIHYSPRQHARLPHPRPLRGILSSLLNPSARINPSSFRCPQMVDSFTKGLNGVTTSDELSLLGPTEHRSRWLKRTHLRNSPIPFTECFSLHSNSGPSSSHIFSPQPVSTTTRTTAHIILFHVIHDEHKSIAMTPSK